MSTYIVRTLIDGLAEDKDFGSRTILAHAAFDSTVSNYRRAGLDAEITVQLLKDGEIEYETTIEADLEFPTCPDCFEPIDYCLGNSSMRMI